MTSTEAILGALDSSVREAFARVEALVCDVDGVLTDGRIHVSSDGSESMSFHVRDGSGTWMLHKAGLRVGLITGRSTGIPSGGRGAMKVDEVVEGCREKAGALRAMSESWGIPLERIAYIGDDLLDGPALSLAGLALSVADGTVEVRRAADYVTRRRGGAGAVREVADLILEARGDRVAVLDLYLPDREDSR